MTHQEEIEYLRSEMKRNPNDLHLYSDLCDIMIGAGMLDEAVGTINKLIKINPEEPPLFFLGHRNLSHIYLSIGRHDRALEESRIIERAYPYLPQWELRGHIYYMLRDYQQSEMEYHSEFVNPGCTDSQVASGNLAWLEGFANIAKADYKMGTIYDSSCPQPFVSWGQCLIHEGKPDKAENILKTVMEKEPNYGDTYIALGDLERKRKNYPRAISYYREAIKRDGNRVAEFAWANMGKTYLEMAQRAQTPPYKKIAQFILPAILVILIILLYLKRKDVTDNLKHGMTLAIISIIAICCLSVISYLVFSRHSPLTGYMDPKLELYQKAEDATINAMEINPRRKDLREDLAISYKGQGRLRESEEQEKIAALLPNYDTNRQLRFSFP